MLKYSGGEHASRECRRGRWFLLESRKQREWNGIEFGITRSVLKRCERMIRTHAWKGGKRG